MPDLSDTSQNDSDKNNNTFASSSLTRPISAVSYLTNREMTKFTNRHILQQIHTSDRLFITKPKKMPCPGMTFSDLERLKLKLAQAGIKVDRSAILNGLSTPYPTVLNLNENNNSSNGEFGANQDANSATTSQLSKNINQKLLSQNRNKYPFPIPGETLVPLAKHGLSNPNIGNPRAAKAGKGKKGKKKGKKKK